ncbi:hypothetical protein [Rufibacter quisquiliarum]|uniref:Uncharacterized protein n=1 Tax=Rufibacter quisquiliarum TaxID=1549639 RepID=A0A839GVR2_9BACT|nr:hypothetical protein [Rufibacter quisquiliarum]MBA9078957.1 hypothetical protein [Rufibacter quisquiliarum]
MIEVIQALRQHITSKIPSIKKVERWNNQLSNEGKGVISRLDVVYLEFANITTVTVSRGVQHCTVAPLRVRLPGKGTEDGDVLLGRAQELYKVLQGFSGGPLLTPMERVKIYQDTKHDSIEQMVQDFTFKYTDDYKAVGRSQSMTPELEVTA